MSYAKKIFFKIIIIGDASVGKSCLLNRFVDNEFKEDYIVTIGVDFKFKDITLNELPNSPVVRFQIWDTAGQEKFRSMTHIYFKGSDVAICVFDLTCIQSKNSIFKIWVNTIKENISNPNIVIIANKSDKEDKIDTHDVKEFCRENKYKYYEVSAKNGNNVENVFRDIALDLYNSKQYNKVNEENKLEIQKINKEVEEDNCCF